MIRAFACAVLAVLAVLAVPAPTHAHPLGNFTVNQYAGLRITTTTVEVDYVLDLAELPTVTERDRIQTLGAAAQCAQIAAAASLRADQRTITLTGTAGALTFPAGAAGLATTRLECRLHATWQLATATTLRFAFGSYTDRLGLREITAIGDGTTISHADASATSRTTRLTAYPTDLLAAPMDMRQAAITVAPGGSAAALTAPSDGSKPNQPNVILAALTAMTGRTQLTTGIALLGLLLAVLLGAGHAIAPGHGKTIMAAYLIGQKGRRRQALAIAATVTATHTAGVLLLGLVITASFAFAPQSLYRWLAFANGLLVAGIGLILLRRALHGRHHEHDHHHHHHHHHHHDDHHYGRDRQHHDHDHHDHSEGGRAAGGTSAVPLLTLARPHTHSGHHHLDRHHETGPSRKTVLAMGFVGGLTPSPSAVVVLLGAAAVGRAWFGVLLVVAYGIGMAATLTGVGMALARFADQLQALITHRWGSTVLRRLPAGTGALILLIGLGIAAFALLDPAGVAR